MNSLRVVRLSKKRQGPKPGFLPARKRIRASKDFFRKKWDALKQTDIQGALDVRHFKGTVFKKSDVLAYYYEDALKTAKQDALYHSRTKGLPVARKAFTQMTYDGHSFGAVHAFEKVIPFTKFKHFKKHLPKMIELIGSSTKKGLDIDSNLLNFGVSKGFLKRRKVVILDTNRVKTRKELERDAPMTNEDILLKQLVSVFENIFTQKHLTKRQKNALKQSFKEEVIKRHGEEFLTRMEKETEYGKD